ncbi:unnamed protein product [Staurois parvus]|uniref:Olfactory receptor n=1 Tax=Staurois parvus TaxID=386267 RepID=A0ABN9AVA4_9NEOB|nr:unnamed protein product [Staurois parvus]
MKIPCNLFLPIQLVSNVTEFIFFSDPEPPELQQFTFLCISFIYLFILSSNGIIFFLVIFDRHLHTPMYFFVSNLSFRDMTYTSVIVPKMLAKFLMNLNTISYTASFVQMYVIVSLGATECYLLAVMAYDRYVAICSPLHYQIIMTRQLCIILSMAAWCGGFAAPLAATILALKLPYCGPNIIYHYYCDDTLLLSLASADISFHLLVGSFSGAVVFLSSFSVIFITYTKIILTILRISSKGGRKKTFSICASHFTVVSIFFLPFLFMYLRPPAIYSSEVDSFLTMLYTVLTPTMNPIIYSMRNKDIKIAFQRKIGFICTRSSLATE